MLHLPERVDGRRQEVDRPGGGQAQGTHGRYPTKNIWSGKMEAQVPTRHSVVVPEDAGMHQWALITAHSDKCREHGKKQGLIQKRNKGGRVSRATL